MQLCKSFLLISIIAATTAMVGCATGGGSGQYQSFMEKCMANATTEQERSECAWENSSRMASGGR